MHVEHPSDLSRLSRIAAYYLMAVTFYLVIWTARISILFSIIRIDPDPIMRRRLKWLAALFVAAIGFFLAQLFWTCETMHNGWKNAHSPQCHLPKQVAICQLVCTHLFTHASRWPHSSEPQPPQPTSLLTYRLSCCPSVSFEVSRIRVSAGVSFSSSPHRVRPLFLIVFARALTTLSSCHDDCVPRACGIHHHRGWHPCHHLCTCRRLHVPHCCQRSCRRDGLIPPHDRCQPSRCRWRR